MLNEKTPFTPITRVHRPVPFWYAKNAGAALGQKVNVVLPPDDVATTTMRLTVCSGTPVPVPRTARVYVPVARPAAAVSLMVVPVPPTLAESSVTVSPA